MNFIWDIILTAQGLGMKKEDIFFEMAENSSPWYEQSFTILNEKEIPNPKVPINPLFRFGETFGAFLHSDLDEMEELKGYILDIALHFICEADLQKGITPQDVYKKFIKDEFLNFGASERMVFFKFTLEEQEKFLICYLNQLKIGSHLTHFREMVHHIYPNAILYQIKDEPEELLLYLDCEKTQEREEKLQLLLDCFLPLFYRISLFWDRHFGVIEVKETMKLEEIQLFS